MDNNSVFLRLKNLGVFEMKPVFNGYEEKFLTGKELIDFFPDEYITDKRHHMTVMGISVADYLSLHRSIKEEENYRIFFNENFCNVMREGSDKNLLFFGHTTLKHVKLSHTPDEIHTTHICPDCGGKMELKNGRYGMFLGCSNYSKTNCKHTEHIFILGNCKDVFQIMKEDKEEGMRIMRRNSERIRKSQGGE